MPSVRYYNQTAPFWDWVAQLEEQGAQHPFFGGRNQQGEDSTSDNEQQRPNPWADGWGAFPFGPFPHRGRRHGSPGRHCGPPPPPPNGPPPNNEKDPQHENPDEGPSEPRGPPPPFSDGPPPHHGPGPHPHHSPGGDRGRGSRRGRGGFGGPWGRHGQQHFGPGGFGGLAEMFQSQIFGDGEKTGATEKSEDFKPDVDVFDTTEAFVVHVSLPGAKKEDVGVNWDSEKSELNIAGVVYRPGDEELLKTLALDERKAGAFERKVRLGSRANPAQVDMDGISAKLEDGVLRVEVPKLDAGYVEVKKVDIE
ncbi:hypothetical protein LTR86_006321 [Recurvomyces mirabilis]|nr:hypothetical protein LTR86_006321 [Recurvomyces mirabilis]